MKSILLSVVVISALVVAGVGGTFAGFVDTEVSEGNLYQAGSLDLLVDGSNDPSSVFNVTCGVPCTSADEWVEVENRGECTGAMLYLHFKDVVSVEAGIKDGEICERTPDATDENWVFGYRTATGDEPIGANVATSEPELGAEEGGNYIAQYYIEPDRNPDGSTNNNPDPNLMGQDYASGIADHLGVIVYVCDNNDDGWLDNPDSDGDGTVDKTEEAAATWIAKFSGKLVDIECDKTELGKLNSQDITFIHFDVHLQQLYAIEWYDADGDLWGTANYDDTNGGVDYDKDGDIDADDFQKAVWPTNALQGDKATWAMLWELNTDF